MGYVYLIVQLEPNQQPTGLYKIGKTSKTPEERLAQLRTSSTFDLEVYHWIRCLDYSAVEKDLHRKFEYFRWNYGGREWFNFRDYDIDDVVEEMNSYVEDPAPTEPVYYSSEESDSTYSYWKESESIYEYIGAAILLFMLGLGVWGIASINNQPSLTKDQRNYHAAWNVFSRKNMDSFEQYTQAQEKFKKLADSSSNECVKKYGEDMVAVISQSKTFLNSTGGNYVQAWKRFEFLGKQVWPKQPVCNRIMTGIRQKIN
ncbi:hypothetical protein BJP34_25990 [Moorena producens PAL-8-15-08-1]|uniref:Bacteriophage T5 Orf172 DNA-binding domain-containing protein n=2 Tax=Moorena TaxID=1155738 RepID=A0A1D8TXR2_9CYAN|nr:hypothetical protein BJP34_25990 [Moorena producens PAL-8-15-08-1]